MNLHQIVAGAVSAVNPMIPATLIPSAGYAKDANYKQVPAYGTPQTGIMIQVQALAADEIRQVDALNIQGVKRAVYLNGAWSGVIRADKDGGDLMKFPDHLGGPERTWLVVLALESWPDWSKVAVALQVDEHV